MFHKILIANRGEIAVRIIRACREMGIKSAVVCSDADRDGLPVMLADEAVCVGPAPAAESYLNIERILSAAVAIGADAIHPGFGFLSENVKFAALCKECGIAFIGPDAGVIAKMGDKERARNTMRKAGIPIIPGSDRKFNDPDEAFKEARKIGFPVMIKAALGGGGKGTRVCGRAEDFTGDFLIAREESVKSFADDSMYLEKYISSPRHIEFQILADKNGDVIHLGERDCSIQRNRQKILEESPASGLDPAIRRKMGETAIRAAKAARYENAGTIEFLLDRDHNFYFMEMNTRIQVEHPVTEMVTGIDLVKEQIRIAAGEKLRFRQKDITLRGHAIECRINAENPREKFRPSPGRITNLHIPGGNGIRCDTFIYNNYEIKPFYDSMLLKLISRGENRAEAIAKTRSALGELIIEGPDTNIDFAYELISHEAFGKGKINTAFIERYFPEYL